MSPERTCSLELGEGRVHLTGELLEDAMRGRGLGIAQDAVDGTRLLEAPSPLVLVVIVVPPWWWWQRRETGVALRVEISGLKTVWTAPKYAKFHIIF